MKTELRDARAIMLEWVQGPAPPIPDPLHGEGDPGHEICVAIGNGKYDLALALLLAWQMANS